MRKICVIGTSRATYGYKRKILQLLRDDKSVKLNLLITGMHLQKKFGYSVKDIIKDKIPITKKIYMNVKNSSDINFILSLSEEMRKIATAIKNINPDILLVTGDRSEMFIACFVAVFLNIPVAHIQAGDVSGHIDGNIRHAITKLSHIHFASCLDSKNRVLKLGEERKRVYNVGAPQLDDMKGIKKDKSFLKNFLNSNISSPCILMMQHPILIDSNNSGIEILETLKALENTNFINIIIYPNFDTGSSAILQKIDQYKKKKNFFVFSNLNRTIFLKLLRNVDLLVGNSSCGILETPSYKVPTINIGNRQRGRMQALNIINCSPERNQISKAIKYVLSNKKFKKKLNQCRNFYGDGNSSKRIVKILKAVKLNKQLLDKKITY
jgi:UDP-N-acetylglucosamine 2-epimerase (non-hydrolysing)/GDP/UDP-N,N'-diacetylbacillosamine 2-epimerase (hydrolysing)